MTVNTIHLFCSFILDYDPHQYIFACLCRKNPLRGAYGYEFVFVDNNICSIDF